MLPVASESRAAGSEVLCGHAESRFGGDARVSGAFPSRGAADGLVDVSFVAGAGRSNWFPDGEYLAFLERQGDQPLPPASVPFADCVGGFRIRAGGISEVILLVMAIFYIALASSRARLTPGRGAGSRWKSRFPEFVKETMTENYRIAIVGAGSLRGKELNEALGESAFAAADFVLLDDGEFAGQDRGGWRRGDGGPSGRSSLVRSADFVFFAGDEENTLKHWKAAARSGREHPGPHLCAGRRAGCAGACAVCSRAERQSQGEDQS